MFAHRFMTARRGARLACLAGALLLWGCGPTAYHGTVYYERHHPGPYWDPFWDPYGPGIYVRGDWWDEYYRRRPPRRIWHPPPRHVRPDPPIRPRPPFEDRPRPPRPR